MLVVLSYVKVVNQKVQMMHCTQDMRIYAVQTCYIHVCMYSIQEQLSVRLIRLPALVLKGFTLGKIITFNCDLSFWGPGFGTPCCQLKKERRYHNCVASLCYWFIHCINCWYYAGFSPVIHFLRWPPLCIFKWPPRNNITNIATSLFQRTNQNAIQLL